MQFTQTFVPTAVQVGALAMVAEFFLLGAVFAFFAAFVFFLSVRGNVAPRHRAAMVLSAIIALVAAASYWSIQGYYHDMLHQLAATADPIRRRQLIHDAFLAINQYRYVEWAVAAPLLLLRITLILKAKPREMLWPLGGLLAVAFLTVLAAYIGEQQIASNGALLAGRRYIWGGLAALGYAALPAILFWRLGPRFGGNRQDEEGHAFRLLVIITLACGLVCPVGYLVPAVFPNANLNWLHLALTAADLVVQIGVGVAAYLVGARELERRVPHEAVQSARMVG